MALVSVLAVLSVGGCTASDLDKPVPTVAGPPFLCDGVPLTGLQRMTGIRDLVVDKSTQSPWGRGFLCEVDDADGFVATISRRDTEGLGFGTPEEQVAELRANSRAVPIVADARGSGFVIADDSQPLARWICDDGVRTDVSLLKRPDSKDLEEDLAHYMISILPWVCGDQSAPKRTVGK